MELASTSAHQGDANSLSVDGTQPLLVTKATIDVTSSPSGKVTSNQITEEASKIYRKISFEEHKRSDNTKHRRIHLGRLVEVVPYHKNAHSAHWFILEKKERNQLLNQLLDQLL